MSTILKSLRKLEDEKSVLDKKVKLKDLVIQEDNRPKTAEEETPRPRQWWAGLLLLLGGIAVGVVAVWLMQPRSSTTQQSFLPEPESKTVSKSEPRNPSSAVTTQGVPLSSIPDFTQRPERDDEGMIIEEDLEPTDPVPGSMAYPVAEETVAPPLHPDVTIGDSTTTLPEISPSVETGGPDSVASATKVLESAPTETTTSPLADQQILDAVSRIPVQTRRAISPQPDTTPLQLEPVGDEIPGLKIKGIIFFGEGSPENYIFFTLPDSDIHRLKVGESVADATLKEIFPGRAIFDYHDKTVQLHVGS